MILRREISASGRSRAFVDGALATSAALRELSGLLVDLHGQHEHQVLLDPATHIDLLDAFAGVGARARGGRRGLRRLARPDRPSATGGSPARATTPRAPSSCPSSWPRSTASRRSPAKTTSSRRRARCWPTPTGCSVSAPTPTTPSTTASSRAPGARHRLEAPGRARGHRPALHPAPRRARRRQIAARGSGLLPALVRRRHRRLAGAAAGGRRPAGAARTSEEEARADAGRRASTRRRSCGGTSTTSSTAPSAPPRSTRRSRPRGTPIWREAEALSARRAKAAATFARRSSGRCGDLAMARTRCEVRFTPPSSEAEWGPQRGRAGRALHLAEPRRGPPAARAHRLGRRAVADHAGAEDAGLDRRARARR